MAQFTAHLGFMPGGNDMHSGNMTITEAKEWCASHPECQGFTFAGPPGTPPSDALLDVYFKSSAEWSPGDGWHTYVQKKVEAPAAANLSHNMGFMPGGNDMHSGNMTITEAKEWCASHPECQGFTFAGPPGTPPSDALLDVYFKSSAEWSPGDGWHTFVKDSGVDKKQQEAAAKKKKQEEERKKREEEEKKRKEAEQKKKNEAEERKKKQEEERRKQEEEHKKQEQAKKAETKVTFTHHEGYMPSGKDLHSAEMSIADAKKMCETHSECLGFTFAGPPGTPPDTAVLQIHFKSSAEWSPGEGWHTVLAERAAVTPAASPWNAPAAPAAAAAAYTAAAAPPAPKSFSSPGGGAVARWNKAACGGGASASSTPPPTTAWNKPVSSSSSPFASSSTSLPAKPPSASKPRSSPSKGKRASSDSSGFSVIGVGPGGVDEMRSYLDPSRVWYGLLKFVVGTGSFARTKFIFVHWNGECCSAVKRGRANSKKGAALSKISGTHAEIIFTAPTDCNIDFVFDQIASVFYSDDDIGDATFSISAMKADYEAMIAANQVATLTVKVAEKPQDRPTAIDFAHPPNAEQCLAAVRDKDGPFNWALFKAKASPLSLVNAGGGSVMQMERYLKDDQVCFGLLRMSFGAGNLRRTKWIFLQWSGEQMGMVQRGRANAAGAAMKTQLRPFNMSIVAHHTLDVKLRTMVDRVQRSIVVDGQGEHGESADVFTIDAFMSALAEEAKRTADYFGAETPQGGAGNENLDFKGAVKKIKDPKSPLCWGLFASEGQEL